MGDIRRNNRTLGIVIIGGEDNYENSSTFTHFYGVNAYFIMKKMCDLYCKMVFVWWSDVFTMYNIAFLVVAKRLKMLYYTVKTSLYHKKTQFYSTNYTFVHYTISIFVLKSNTFWSFFEAFSGIKMGFTRDTNVGDI